MMTCNRLVAQAESAARDSRWGMPSACIIVCKLMRKVLTLLFSLSLAAAAGADVYIVTNTNDTGAGSLRQAIADANAHLGLDSIDFNVPTTDRVLINVLTPLMITSPLLLDGATQALGKPEPPVILDRFGGMGDILTLNSGADGSEVRNLEIRGANGPDVAALRIAGATGVKVAGNVIGGNPGQVGLNEIGLVVSTSNNQIGGFTKEERNIIGGNSVGLLIDSGAFENVIAGNYFGVDATGTGRLTNFSAGIVIQNGENNVIGGTTDTARNVIDSSPAGIIFFKPSRANRIERNYIGTTPEGLAHPDLRNTQGIVLGGVGDNLVARNLISNNGTGIVVAEGFGQIIQNNLIGVDPDAMRAVPNGTGISVANVTDVAELRIGGSFGEGNRICGNTDDGIFVNSTSVIHIEGNIIGVNAIGDAAIPNGTGVRLVASENTTLGGPIASSGNVISGNRGDGVVASRAVISSNLIGVVRNSLNVLVPLPNGGNGITANTDGALTIGGDDAGNVIANNLGWGIDVGGTATVAARTIAFNIIRNNAQGGIRLRQNARQTIRLNSIGHNAGLGIDLGGDGVTLNDNNDGDGGANQRQNFPQLNSFSTTSTQISIAVTLNSTPNTTFTLDFYSSPEADASTFGEGETWLGTVTTTTNAFGSASVTKQVPAEGNLRKFITATATDPAGNTSEFSRALFIGPSAPPKHRSVRH